MSFSEIQGKALGMAVEIFDSSGKNIEHTAHPGELVCTRPHPSLPIGFWGDPDGEKLRKAYFDVYPGNARPLSLRVKYSKGTFRGLAPGRLHCIQS